MAEIFDAIPGSDLERKTAVALALGYVSAHLMVHLHETFGFSIVDQTIWLARHEPGLRIDWAGLASGLAAIGKSDSAIDALIREARSVRRAL